MIWIARHSETTWNLRGRYQGRLESALSGRGLHQAHALAASFAARLRNGAGVPARVVSSPLLRCTATARITADQFGLPVDVDERLIEIAHGSWEGRYRDELARNDPERYRAWRGDPAHVAFEGGETLVDVLTRWRSFAHDLARDERATLVVSHDAVVRCALLEVQGLPLDDFWKMHVENAAFAFLSRNDGRLALVTECDVAHLAGQRAAVARQAL